MKQFLLFISVTLLFAGCKTNGEETDQVNPDNVIPFNASQIDAHNSKNSLDWEGSYSGVLPCDDCVGIETLLEINRDYTYTVIQKFVDSADVLSEELRSEGKFFWNEEGSSITLESVQGDISTFRVGELFLTPLYKNGLEVRAEAGNNFKLLKR